jgi:hypothetical protein
MFRDDRQSSSKARLKYSQVSRCSLSSPSDQESSRWTAAWLFLFCASTGFSAGGGVSTTIVCSSGIVTLLSVRVRQSIARGAMIEKHVADQVFTTVSLPWPLEPT